eukprot:TRINITY_DN8118_c0_g1_i2.p1 TRINITY_DN8118_c0_g1~~TRINITY_DN8118_c0_g1_i2.p1  ORF type:complete len:290 (+),score=21.77 TRINITY_DN8118_c0_g1_i2:121-990(+)
MASWQPSRYLRFGLQRLRPALDLLYHVQPRKTPKLILDFGCGTGSAAKPLLERWPKSEYVGVDSSEAMLDKARKDNDSLMRSHSVRFVQGDVSKYRPERRADLIFSNSTFHWIPDHNTLFSHLHSIIRSEGILAFQIPDTRKQSSHLLMIIAANNVGLGEKIRSVRIPRCEYDQDKYFDMLNAKFTDVDLWTTTYCQQLERTMSNLNPSQYHPVTEYTRSTGLQPVIDALGGEDSKDATRFMQEYDSLIQKRYKPNTPDTILFPFTRFFCIAQKPRPKADPEASKQKQK